MPRTKRRRVLAIGDTHFPWHSRRTLRAIYKAMRELQPDVVIQMGDLFDLFAWSRFPRTYNVYPPQQELALARKEAELMWATVQDIVPMAERIQLMGNHDVRAVKKALATAPELETFAREGILSLMRFDGVRLIADSAQVIDIDGVGFHHGYLLKPGDHAKAHLCSMVVGHTHYGGVTPLKLEKGIIWELNAGFAANRHAVPMSYGEQRRFSRWTLGFGWIDEYGPRFCPLDTEEDP